MKLDNNWDAWEIDFFNAKRFFECKGNVKTKSRLKDKWNKEFMELLKFFFEKGKEEAGKK